MVTLRLLWTVLGGWQLTVVCGLRAVLERSVEIYSFRGLLGDLGCSIDDRRLVRKWRD